VSVYIIKKNYVLQFQIVNLNVSYAGRSLNFLGQTYAPETTVHDNDSHSQTTIV